MSKGRAEKRNIISPENGGGTTIPLASVAIALIPGVETVEES